jgi:hypothetical protein
MIGQRPDRRNYVAGNNRANASSFDSEVAAPYSCVSRRSLIELGHLVLAFTQLGAYLATCLSSR